MKYKIATIIFAILFLLTGLLYINEKQNNEYIEDGKAFLTNWACMDGCYNMEEIILGEINHSNSIQKKYHSECSDLCFDKWFLESEDKNGK